MKKSIIFLAFAAIVSMNAFAQSAEEALQLFNQGKDLFEKYDALYGKAQLDPAAADASRAERTDALLTGFDILQKALVSDTVPEIDKKTGQPKLDKNGNVKVKTKNSEKIIELLANHFTDLGALGDEAREREDYLTACRAYKAYADLSDANFAKKKNLNMADSTKGLVRFLETFSACQASKFDIGYEAMLQCLDLGFNSPETYDCFDYCLQNYLQPMLNDNKYGEVMPLIDKVIAKQPSNPFPYMFKGSVYEQQNDMDNAIAAYQKSYGVNDKYFFAYYNEGRCYYDMAMKIINDPENSNKTSAALAKDVAPLFKKAIPLFEKAKLYDTEGRIDAAFSPARYLDDIDYKLEQFK